MRFRLLPALLVLAIVPLLAGAGRGPRIAVDKLTYSYGKIPYGDVVSKEFTVTNTGDEVLVIDKLRSSCGCAKAVKGETEIKPGGTTKIIASFDTEGLSPGMKRKTIYVSSNDPVNPTLKLTLLAEVVKSVTVVPQSLATNLDGFQEKVVFPVEFSNTSDRSVIIDDLEVRSSDAKAELKPESIALEPGESAKAEVEMRLRKEPSRRYYMGRLVLKTDHPKEKTIDLRYFVQIK